MKKNRFLLLMVLFVPLAMANSPAPNPYPALYEDYELTNTEIEITEEDTYRYIVFRGDFKNSGTGVIDCEHSSISYRFEWTNYNFRFFDYATPGICEAFYAGESYHYEQVYDYDGPTPTGVVEQYIAPTLEIRGYAEESFLQDVVITNITITNHEYNDVDDTTEVTLSFGWDNQGNRSVYGIYLSFYIGETHYVKYLERELGKNKTGTEEIDFEVLGNIVGSEPENVTLSFLPINSYYDADRFDLWDLAVIVMVIAALIFFAPVVILSIILIIKALAMRKNV